MSEKIDEKNNTNKTTTEEDIKNKEHVLRVIKLLKILIIISFAIFVIISIKLTNYIYNQRLYSRDDISQLEAMAWNSQFETYFGDNISEQEVKQLCSIIINNNNTNTNKNKDELTYMYVVFKGNNTKANFALPQDVLKMISSNKTYNVYAQNDKENDEHDNNLEIKPTENSKINSPAYYANGYLKIITIIKA